jgi:uncharacterized protein YnzC (UPF0291/DUF896 family)
MHDYIWYGIKISEVEFVRKIAIFLGFISQCEELTLKHIKIIDQKLEVTPDWDYSQYGNVQQAVEDCDIVDHMLDLTNRKLHEQKCHLAPNSLSDEMAYNNHMDTCKDVVIRFRHYYYKQTVLIAVESSRLHSSDEDIIPIGHDGNGRSDPQFARLKQQFEEIGLPTSSIGLDQISL